MNWISVKDRLPEKTIFCLVYNREWFRSIRNATFWKTTKLFEIHKWEGQSLKDPSPCNPTHWVELTLPETKEKS